MGATARRPELLPIYVVNFIGTLGYSIVLPFLVVVVTQLGGNALVYGVMSATYSAFQFVGAPILGKWSDVWGRRKVLLLSQVGTLVSWVIFLIALGLPIRPLLELDRGAEGLLVLTWPLLILFTARALDGLTGGNVSVANAYLADLTEESGRDKYFAKMAVAGNIGFMLGPILAGLLGATSMGATLPVLAAIFISLLATLIIGFYLPESRPCLLAANPEKSSVRKVFGQESSDCFRLREEERLGLRDALKIRYVPFLLVLYFLIFVGFNIFYAAFPVHALTGLSWSTVELGVFYSFLGLTTILVQGPLLERLSGRFSEATFVVGGGALLALGFWFLTAQSTLLIYLGAALFSLGNGLQWPSFMAVLSRVAGPHHQGAVQGFGGSIGSLAAIAGLVLGGFFYGSLGEATLLVAAASFGVVTVLAHRLFRIL